MATRKEAKLIALACKEAGVKADTLLGSAVYEDAGLVVIVIGTGQKYSYEIERLEAAETTQKQSVKVDPPETNQLKGPAPETTQGKAGSRRK